MSVYTWGFGKSGQLGTGDVITCHTPQRVKHDADIVTQISSGGLYTCCVTEDKGVVSFGCGKHGRLGDGSEDDKLSPSTVPLPPNTAIRKVSCGSWHGAAISEDGRLFMWGYPKACGLGHTVAKVISPTHVAPFCDKGIAGVSCGHNFTLVWTDDGQAFSWGSGRHGALGHGTDEDVLTPKRIETLSDVVSMDAGYAHSGAVTQQGDVYMFGKGTDGALGQGKVLKNSLTPTKVDCLAGLEIIEVSCSVGEHHGHTLALSRCGQVFSWGDGYKGKLGLGDQETRLVPTRIPPTSFNDDPVLHVSAGGIHSAAIIRRGQVFTWGCGSDGRLGHPEAKGHRYLFRSDVPKLVDYFKPGQIAMEISCSYYHTVALVLHKS